MAVTNVICIKYGSRYGAEYPNRLYAGLKRNSPSDIRLFCMTDDRADIQPEIEILPLLDEPFHKVMFAEMARRGWKSPFRKVSLYNPALVPDLDGPMILMDIDLVVVGNPDDLRDYAPGKVAMRHDWSRGPGSNELGHGSVEKFEPQRHSYIYEDMARDPLAALGRSFGREQIYTSTSAEAKGDFQPFPDAWIASFKRDCRPPRPLNLFLPPRKPEGAKVVCFHGEPKMEDAVRGYWGGGNLAQATRPARWLRAAWSG
ncbi:glycosyl transferase [Tabrizicola sp.]|uniref:glycosyl transferase n=1 Tax=Tabrizicola sp. TaxID=2005166 RepID=UPI0035B1679D